jgi:hypothetical protein
MTSLDRHPRVGNGGNDVTRSSSSRRKHTGPRGYLAVKSASPFLAEMTSQDRHPLMGSMLEPRGYLAVKSASPFLAEMTSQDRHPLVGSMLEPRGYLFCCSCEICLTFPGGNDVTRSSSSRGKHAEGTWLFLLL